MLQSKKQIDQSSPPAGGQGTEPNPIFNLAIELVNQSSRNIFLTGKAGTGKTTFLKYIRDNSFKELAVVAPTGVAAINAGGTTIHSFFQLPFSPFLPEAAGFMDRNDSTNKHTLFGKLKLNRERIRILQQLELLIIDEISMVRCDVLDAIDAVLRHFRNRHSEPFGGVQVLLIGDMYQLPPVTANDEWSLLSQFYNSPYFFDSRVMQETPPAFVEFEKIYRQSDQRFIDLLNRVRNNELDDASMNMLQSLYDPNFKVKKEDGYIILTTHNYKADAINAEELSKLNAPVFSFKAQVKGEFNEKSYPADENLQLKVGAQVMFIRNDVQPVRRYFNGKIGGISRIDGDKIYVQCNDQKEEIEVAKELWENFRYTLDRKTNHLQEDMIGSFSQYPLRLAWAITIHKSQGLTFERAVIDAGAAFAPGQVYVALSRCTSMEGIVLHSKITPASLRSDQRIVQFSKRFPTVNQLEDEFVHSRKIYQANVLHSLFDYSRIAKESEELAKMMGEEAKDFNADGLEWITETGKKILAIDDVAKKFRAHLNIFFAEEVLPEQNAKLQKRIADASAYFLKHLDDVMQFVSKSPVETESKVQAKLFNDSLKDLFVLLSERRHMLQGLTGGFSIGSYYQQKKTFTVPSFSVNAYATESTGTKESPHPKLHRQLRDVRNKICEQKDLPIYFVASGKTIDEMVQYLPQTLEELMKISGFGKARAEQFGEQFLEVIVTYSKQNGLTSLVHNKNPKKERKPKAEKKESTKDITYQLFRQGNGVPQIAKLRNLAESTIEGHLAYYVSIGMISVNELIGTEKIVLIEPHLQNYEGPTITPIKEKLGDAVTFSEIRLVLAAKEWERAKNTT